MNASPTKITKQSLTFPEALSKILEGERVTRLEWENESEYGLMLSDGFLGIRHDNQLYSWKLHQSDLLAEDWVIV